MTDIVELLRDRSQFLWTNEQQLSDNKLAKEAADEIERLREALHSIRIHGTEEEAAMAVTALEGK